jgi:hypothetical protein
VTDATDEASTATCRSIVTRFPTIALSSAVPILARRHFKFDGGVASWNVIPAFDTPDALFAPVTCAIGTIGTRGAEPRCLLSIQPFTRLTDD